MQNVTLFPNKIEVLKPTRKKEKPKQTQQLTFLKMIAAIVIGNGIVLAGLFGIFLLYLITSTPFVD